MVKKNLLPFAALLEASFGLILLLFPALIIKLLFGAELTDLAAVISRLTGISLMAFGIACWPKGTDYLSQPILGMFLYNFLVTVYFLYLGTATNWVGFLLWPTVFLHGLLAILFINKWLYYSTR